MNRKNLLKSLGLIGLGAIFPVPKTLSKINKLAKTEILKNAGCWLTPEKTEGPFYFNSNLYRQDIRTDSDTNELHPGLQLNMAFTIIDVNCNPIPNALVDIWHTDKDGVYSGYGSTAGQDFMRGIQVTDVNGRASFITSYPGWYPGRATHIHFKVRLNSTTYVTSQFAFPNDINDAVYATPLYSGRGPNPKSNEEDNIFGTAKPEYLLMTVVPNLTTGGYDGTYTIGINAPTGVNESDLNPNEINLEQNFPNPFNPSTTIRYTLPRKGDVNLVVFDVFGQVVGSLINQAQEAGTHEAIFRADKMSSGIYFYRLAVSSVSGNVMMTKEMLYIK